MRTASSVLAAQPRQQCWVTRMLLLLWTTTTAVVVSDAWIFDSPSFRCLKKTSSSSTSWTIDTESPEPAYSFASNKLWLPPRALNKQQRLDIQPTQPKKSWTASHGMPWKTSIVDDYDELTYMPFWEYQMDYMYQHLTELRPLSVKNKAGTRDLSYVEGKPTARMHTCVYTSEEYSRIRLTSLDAGNRIQVFTSLWYPRTDQMPVLGIDFLKFNKKHLCIMDFQPLVSAAKEEYDENRLWSQLAKVRNKFPSLQQTMTDRFYNSTDPYFSNQMLLGRTTEAQESEQMVQHDLTQAFAEYLHLHVGYTKDRIRRQQRQSHHQLSHPDKQQQRLHEHDYKYLQRLHQEYDTYSAHRDPAHGLLAKTFGQDFADDYMFDILFPNAQR